MHVVIGANMLTDTEIVGGIATILTGMSSAIAWLFKENVRKDKEHAVEKDEIEKENSKCRQDLAQVRAELVSLNALMEQAGWTGGPTLEAVIVCNAEGIIVEWNPGATIMFHWVAREMLGKNVTMIIPPAYRQNHLGAMSNWRAKDESPRRGPFLLHAQTKDGIVFPIEMTLSGWKVGDAKFVAAAIRRRLTMASSIPESDSADILSKT